MDMAMHAHGMCTCVWQRETDGILGLLHPLFVLACDSMSLLGLVAKLNLACCSAVEM